MPMQPSPSADTSSAASSLPRMRLSILVSRFAVDCPSAV